MTRKLLTALVLLSALAALFGCASVGYEWINPENEEEAGITGIRYLETSPFLLVHSNPDGTLHVEVVYLPDKYKKMSVSPSAKFAKIETTLEFDRGVLTKANTKADATAVPKALLKAAEAVIPKLSGFLNDARAAGKDDYWAPGPHIYKIIVRGSDVFFVGGAGDNFQVTLIPVEKKEAKGEKS